MLFGSLKMCLHYVCPFFGVWYATEERPQVPISVEFPHILESYLDSGLILLRKIVRNRNGNKMGEYKRLITADTRAEGERSYKNNQRLRSPGQEIL